MSYTIPEEIIEKRNEFVRRIYDYTVPEMIRDERSLLKMLYDIGQFHNAIFLGEVMNLRLIVEGIDKNFKYSFMKNVTEVSNQDEIDKLKDSKYFTNLLKKQPLREILNLYIQREKMERGYRILGLELQIYLIGCPIRIEGKNHEITLDGNINFVHEDTATIELFHCNKIDEERKEKLSKLTYLRRLRYSPEKIKELHYITNSSNALIRMRNKRFWKSV